MGAAYLRGPTAAPPGYVHGAAQCAGKVAFETPALAHEVADRHRREAYRKTVYRCWICNRWHIGTGNANADNAAPSRRLALGERLVRPEVIST